MTKKEFLSQLRSRLSGLPEKELDERLNFYSEMLDDRIEDGTSEEDAVDSIGTVDSVAEQIIADTPFLKIAKEKIKPKRKLGTLEITLLAVGSPIWISLLAAVFSVVISIFASVFAVCVSLWAVFVSFVATAFACEIVGIVFTFNGNAAIGFATVGIGLIFAGLSIFALIGCRLATKGIVLLTKKIIIAAKRCFVGKGDKVNE